MLMLGLNGGKAEVTKQWSEKKKAKEE